MAAVSITGSAHAADEPIVRPEPRPLIFGESAFPLTDQAAAVSSILAADFNGDGHQDLAWVAQPNPFDDADFGTRVMIARGFGDGRFVEVLALDTPARELAVADFDGDLRPDLAIADESVTLRYNTGPFEFGEPVETGLAAGSVSTFGMALTPGDFDGDGDTDLALTDAEYRLDVGLNDGGVFTLTPSTPTEDTQGRPRVLDVDLDGINDLLQLAGSSTLVLRRGTATGVFGEEETVLNGYSRFSVFTGSENGETLIAAAKTAFNGTWIFRTDAALGIDPAPIATLDETPRATQPRLLDFDADGFLDIAQGTTIVYRAIANVSLRRVSTAPLALTPPMPPGNFEANDGPTSLLLDVNGDGAPDRITPGYVRLNLRDDLLLTRHAHREIGPTLTKHSHVASADFDGDGLLDVVAAGFGELEIRYGQSTGTLGLRDPLGPANTLPITMTDYSGFITLTPDVDGDGDPDIVALDRSPRVAVLLNLGDRSFFAAQNINLSTRLTNSDDLAGIAQGNQNGDQWADFVVLDDDNDQLHTLFGTGFLLEPGPVLQLPPSRYSTVALIDIDSDGVRDAVIGDADGERILFALGSLDGSFELLGPIFLPTSAYWLQAADADSDGQDDLIVTTRDPAGIDSPILIWFREPNGTLGFFPLVIPTTLPALETAVADLNGDGYNDLVTVEASAIDGAVTVLSGEPVIASFPELERFSIALTSIRQVFPAGILAEDLNDDGAHDLLWTSNALTLGYALQDAPVLGCLADLTGDGIVDAGDISAFVELFLDADPAADLNRDTIIDNGDRSEFVMRFLAGC